MLSTRSKSGVALPLPATLMLAACAGYVPFDGSQALAPEFERRLGSGLAERIVVPFAMDNELREAVNERVSPAGSEARRRDAALDFIFGRVDLQYELAPTRTAAETFAAARGNCLSFVNLFVAVGRERRLNPFFVEVEDYQRWNYQDGVVVSRGHIVAGMYVDGEMATYDFLPYRPKSYRDFRPITDLAATGHYYNNLGAEALMGGDLDGRGALAGHRRPADARLRQGDQQLRHRPAPAGPARRRGPGPGGGSRTPPRQRAAADQPRPRPSTPRRQRARRRGSWTCWKT